MGKLKSALKLLLVFLIISVIGYIVVANYGVIFSKTVVGEVVGVEKIDAPLALLNRPNTQINPQVFSFAIAIKDLKTNEIHTSSAEDRQWAVVAKGQCAEAVYLPYPPWDFEKKGTYHGARLIKLFECQK